jgi:hypothetical protein
MKKRVLTEDDLDRLAKLLGMVGSAHDGEALSAARMAHRMLTDLGLTWHDVIKPICRPEFWRPSFEDLIDFALDNGDGILNGWELQFLASLCGRDSLTPKQIDKLHVIVAKVAARSAAA